RAGHFRREGRDADFFLDALAVAERESQKHQRRRRGETGGASARRGVQGEKYLERRVRPQRISLSWAGEGACRCDEGSGNEILIWNESILRDWSLKKRSCTSAAWRKSSRAGAGSASTRSSSWATATPWSATAWAKPKRCPRRFAKGWSRRKRA